MSSIRSAARPATLSAVLLAAAWLAACGAGAQSASTDPGTRSVTAVRDVLTREQIDRIRPNSMQQLFRGRFRGVQVLDQDGEPTLRIRGEGEPLLVLDGMPISGLRSLWGLDPADVEQIEILRETAAAIYGQQGFYGAVRITTRRR
jgi:outer membrane cobalamin receptor